jgi:hypothetical protein
MTTASDTYEWKLLKKNLTATWGILPVISGSLYIQINEAGSGELKIPASSAIAANVEVGTFAELYYRGAYRGGFFVENIQTGYADDTENEGREMSLSGRGAMAMLDDAIVWDDGISRVDGKKKFPLKTSADVLLSLLAEAKARGCFPSLSADFTAILDSDGNAWTDLQEFEFDVGMTLSDVVGEMVGLGMEVRVVPNHSGGFVLQAYKSMGSDKSLEQFFRIGTNCKGVGYNRVGTKVKNALRVKYKGGYMTKKDTDSKNAYRRREEFYDAASAGSSYTAGMYANAHLQNVKEPFEEISVEVLDDVPPHLFVDYDLGDWVKLDRYGTEEKRRVNSAHIKFTDEWARVQVDLNSVFQENEIKMWRDIERLKHRFAHDSNQLDVALWVGLSDPAQFTGTEIRAMAQQADKLYIGGAFTRIGGIAANNVAVYDLVSQTFSALGTGLTESVADFYGSVPIGPICRAILVDGGDVYFTGAFKKAGGTTCNSIARWNGATWSALANGLGWLHVVNQDDGGFSLAKYGSDIMVGGHFNIGVGGGYADYLDGDTIHGLAAWDGSAYSKISSAIGFSNAVFAQIVDGSILYFGGDMDQQVQTWNGLTVGALMSPAEMTGHVYALTIADDSLIAGGSISKFGTTDLFGVARYTDPGWESVGEGFDLEIDITNRFVSGLAVYMSDIYAVGKFIKTKDGVETSLVAQWDGSSWITLNKGGYTDSDTMYCAIPIGGDLIVGGSFNGVGNVVAGDVPSKALARWVTSFPSLIQHLENKCSCDIAGMLAGAPEKGALADADKFGIYNSANGQFASVKWETIIANIEATLLTGTADRLAIFNNTGDLAAGAELIWDTTYKVLSIGLVDPIVHDAGSYASLRQTSEGGGASNFLTTYSDTTASFITGIRTRGTSISPSAVKKDDALLRIRGWGHDGTALSSSRTAIYMVADEDWDTSHHGTRLEFHTTPKATTTLALAASLDGDGNLDIKSGGKYKVGGSNLIATATDLGGASPSDLVAPSQKAAKTYIDAKSADWDERSETWTRTDNHTFTLAGDQTATYRKGRKVRYKDGGSYEYGVIKSATYDGGTDKTTVTLIANDDYAMAAGAISDTALSDMTNPPGFPDYFNYTPVLSCSGSMTISSSTIGLACWRADGSMMTVWHNIDLQLGGTAHTTIFVKLPANTLIGALAAAVNCRDTGSGQRPVGAGQIAGTNFAYRLADVSNWTVGGSSNAAILGSGSYPF